VAARRWKTVRGSKRDDICALFAANRRLFPAVCDHPVRFGVVESLKPPSKASSGVGVR
jgi:hypothetical protein